jgi:YHS domain-containing protein
MITHLAKGIALFALAVMIHLSLSVVSQAQGDDSGLVQVETKYVCMINNQRFDKEQIPVAVAGKTYYGCCEMCKAKLKNDPKSRMAVDPVSGKKVDKAKAVIGADAAGKVFYFENVQNLKKFKASKS